MARSDLPSVRAAREQEVAALNGEMDDAEIAQKVDKALRRLYFLTPYLDWVGVSSSLPHADDEVLLGERRVHPEFGVCEMYAVLPMAEYRRRGFPLAFWVADNFDAAYAEEIAARGSLDSARAD